MRCSYRHNMWCNCKKPINKLKSYEEIMGLRGPGERVDTLNQAPVAYHDKFVEEWHMVGDTLQWDYWVVRNSETELRNTKQE